jgi:hypothetical protein
MDSWLRIMSTMLCTGGGSFLFYLSSLYFRDCSSFKSRVFIFSYTILFLIPWIGKKWRWFLWVVNVVSSRICHEIFFASEYYAIVILANVRILTDGSLLSVKRRVHVVNNSKKCSPKVMADPNCLFLLGYWHGSSTCKCTVSCVLAVVVTDIIMIAFLFSVEEIVLTWWYSASLYGEIHQIMTEEIYNEW